MPRTRRAGSPTFIVTVCALLLLLLPAAHAQQAAKKEYPFHGKVEKVDAKNKVLTVDGENVDGWMAAMTMTYRVDKEDVITRVKAGDQITAKVREGDFQTLYDVQVVVPPPKK